MGTFEFKCLLLDELEKYYSKSDCDYKVEVICDLLNEKKISINKLDGIIVESEKYKYKDLTLMPIESFVYDLEKEEVFSKRIIVFLDNFSVIDAEALGCSSYSKYGTFKHYLRNIRGQVIIDSAFFGSTTWNSRDNTYTTNNDIVKISFEYTADDKRNLLTINILVNE